MAIVSSIALGVVGEIIMFASGPALLTLFEGNDELLPNADELIRIQSSVFVLTVLMSAAFAVMFGRNELVYTALTFMPALFIFVAAAGLFKHTEDLAIFVGADILISIQLSVCVVYRNSPDML